MAKKYEGAVDHGVMRAVLDKAVENVGAAGGPFAAAIVSAKDGSLVSLEGNCVTRTNDPTGHAEVTAIRAACAKLGTFDLSGHLLYTSCYPCPMCFGAAYWARVDAVFYAATAADAAAVGFDDAFIYAEIPKADEDRLIRFEQAAKVGEAAHAERDLPFRAWSAKTDKTAY